MSSWPGSWSSVRARKGVELVGPGGLLTDLTKTVLEAALEVEMEDHLGYTKHAPEGRGRGNSRNGARSKTVLTEVGGVEIAVPRDRDGSFEPRIVRKRQRRLAGVDALVISLAAKGLTTGEIAAHFADVYGAEVSRDTISRITDRVLEEMTAWQSRPLDSVYPVVFIDAIVVKIRDGQVANRPVYTVVGVTVEGTRDVLGLWIGDGSEGAKYWHQVLSEIRNRGVADVCIVVCDGLRGLVESVGDVWPLAIVQTCVLHLVRNSFRYASKADWYELARDLRPVYTAPTRAGRQGALRRARRRVGRPLPGDHSALGSGLGGGRALPRLQPRDPASDLLDERDREPARPAAAERPRPRSLPHRAGSDEMLVPRRPQPRPYGSRPTTLEQPMEASPQRLRRHLRGTDQPQQQLTMPNVVTPFFRQTLREP
jgi:transposase-like protein